MWVTETKPTPLRKMYHTQEKRRHKLTEPIMCTDESAWLGNAYYFWDEHIDAIHWGNKKKRKTGYYDIYKSDIDTEDVLDTVFNESHYRFWLKQIEKAASKIKIKTGKNPSIKEINEYFQSRAKWSDKVNGIMFQDLPFSEDLLIKDFNYRKRIQLAAFNIKIIHNFAHHVEYQCN